MSSSPSDGPASASFPSTDPSVTLTDWSNTVCRAVRHAFQALPSTEELVPMLLLRTPDCALLPVGVGEHFRSDATKAALPAHATVICAKHKATACALVTEAWTAMISKEELSEVRERPSLHPRRVETVLCRIEEAGLPTIVAAAQITRMDDKRTLGEFVLMGDLEAGRLHGSFLPVH